MTEIYIPGKVIYPHLFVKAKIINLEITSIIGVAIRDFPIPIPREAIEKLVKGELIGPLVDFILFFGFMTKVQKGEVTPIPEIRHFDIESEGWFLVDTGASTTVINLDALPINLKYTISREVSWALNKVRAITATDVVNLPISKTTIEIEKRKLSTNRAFIVTKGQNTHHILGMDILTSLGKIITFDLPNQRLCIS